MAVCELSIQKHSKDVLADVCSKHIQIKLIHQWTLIDYGERQLSSISTSITTIIIIFRVLTLVQHPRCT